jgi:hypothetical protein
MSLWIATILLLQAPQSGLAWRPNPGMRLVGEVVQKYESAQDDLSIEFHYDVTIEVESRSADGDFALIHSWLNRRLVVDGEVVRISNPATLKFRETRGPAGEWKGASPDEGELGIRRRLGLSLAPSFGPGARIGNKWTQAYAGREANLLPDAALTFRAADSIQNREPWGETIEVTATIQDGAAKGSGRWVCDLGSGLPITAQVRLAQVPIPEGEGALADYSFTWKLTKMDRPSRAGRGAPGTETN